MNRHWRRIAAGAGLACMILGSAVSGAPVAQEPERRIAVTEHGVGTDVVERELKGRGDSFSEGTKVWFWTRVVGGASGDRIQHVWLREGKEMFSVGLSIGGPHWRTYTNKTLYPGSAGSWAVEARDAEDRVLARDEFTCLPAGEESAPLAEDPAAEN